MNKNQKAELAAELKQKFTSAQVALFADYKGLESNQANELRRSLRAHKVEVKVLQNNVARLVTKDGALGDEAKGLMDSVVGPTLVAFAYGDPAAAAKVFHKFAKDNEALKIKDSLLGSKRISAGSVEALASLPSREVLLGKLLGTMNAPISSFVGVLAAVPRALVTVLAAVEKKKSEA
jgi:large subunit ribosomal protein L10